MKISENKAYQNLWVAAKVVLRGKFIAVIYIYLEKTLKSIV